MEAAHVVRVNVVVDVVVVVSVHRDPQDDMVWPLPLRPANVSFCRCYLLGRNYGRAFLIIAVIQAVALVLENAWNE